MADDKKSVVSPCFDRGRGPVFPWVIPHETELPECVRQDLQTLENEPFTSMTTLQYVDDHFNNYCNIVAWYEEDKSYIGCTVLAIHTGKHGKYLKVMAAVARPGKRAIKRIMPHLIKLAKTHKCKGIVYESRRPINKLWPDFNLLSQSYVLELKKDE